MGSVQWDPKDLNKHQRPPPSPTPTPRHSCPAGLQAVEPYLHLRGGGIMASRHGGRGSPSLSLSPKFWNFTALQRGEREPPKVTNKFPAHTDMRELSQISLICKIKRLVTLLAGSQFQRIHFSQSYFSWERFW